MGTCKNCGADYSIHHSETNQCPWGGVEEAAYDRPQIWAATEFEQKVESDAELARVRAERDRLLAAATGIYNEIMLHAPNIISRSQEFVKLAIALDAVAAREVVE